MNAVLRLNLLVALVFLIALTVTVSEMLKQASKDIEREVLSGVSFTHKLLTVASKDPGLLESLMSEELRHVQLDLFNRNQNPHSDEPVDSEFQDMDSDEHEEEEVPRWFVSLIPGIEELEEKKYVRYLADGRALRLQADTSDEVEEVWESVQAILLLFLMGAVLSNLAIYFGVRQGIKPIAHFLAALDEIQKGHYKARLSQYNIREINELSKHFNEMAQALEEAEADNKLLTHEMMRVQEKERAHLARELHDDLGQYLTGIQAQAYLVQQAKGNGDVVATVAEQIATNCNAMQTSFRQLIRDLHPVILEQLGLGQAIENLLQSWQRNHDIKVHSVLPDQLPSFSDEYSTHIYRVVQEALHNVSRHSGASEVEVLVQLADQRLLLKVSDNGSGIENIDSTGMGMRSMKERARCMGGNLECVPSPSGGCCIYLVVPINGENKI